MKTFTQRRWLWLILASYLALGSLYLLATPPLEASDEYKHYPVVQYIETAKKLPVLESDNPGLWLQEGAQPPLYYLLMAAITGWIDTTDLDEVHQINPHAFVGNPNQIGNKNIIIHQPEQEIFPSKGTILAIYLARTATLILGIGTLIITYRLGKILFSETVALLAVGLVAFNPMFLFISTAVNNDALSALLGVWGLYRLVKLWQDQPDPRQEWWQYGRLGLLLGLGILTKLSAAGLLLLAGLALFILAWRHQKWSLFWIGGPIIVTATLLISGWWFWRNIQLYGDLTGLNAFIAVQGTRNEPITWAGWIDEFGTFFRSYWGLFGGVNVAAPNGFYWAYNGLVVVGVLGWLRSKKLEIRDWRLGNGHWLLLGWGVILLGLLVRWNMISPAFQGRLLFPNIGGLHLLWAVGLLFWLPSQWHKRATAVLLTILLIIAAIIPYTVIRPAYAFPEPLTAVPNEAKIDPITFQHDSTNTLQLIGAEVATEQSITPAGKVPIEVTLYWQALAEMEIDYVTAVHLLGHNYESAGSVNRYPANGAIPTSRWQMGQIWRDVYHIYPHEFAEAPSILRINVSVVDTKGGKDLTAVSDNNTPLDLIIIGEARLAQADPLNVTPTNPLTIPFNDYIQLNGYDLSTLQTGHPLTITFHWEATGTPSQPYTIFVHLLDSTGNPIIDANGTQMTGDAPPLNNNYPTNLWQASDTLLDPHTLHLPADLPTGSYQIAIGLYDPLTGVRLMAKNGRDAILLPIDIK